MLKNLMPLGSVLLVAACSTNPLKQQSANYQLHVTYHTAVNELPLPRMETNTIIDVNTINLKPSSPNSNSVQTLGGFDYAVKCNEAKSQCWHSHVYPTLEYRVLDQGDSSLLVKGQFISQAGREIVSNDSGSYVKLTIDKDVPVWIEGTEVIPFSLSTDSFEPLQLEAPTGNKITLRIDKIEH
ncbi:hypothetical protein [Agarivorans sp. QJM3NY_33]|uniref:hypothetical protein n=1 Tax=Agarivorans sp. QJM3NY_33 TaxID=3421432 RepID=UPI003D7DFE31